MTKHGMRGFASGIIAASAVISLFYFQLSPKTEAEPVSKSQITEEDVQSYLNRHGEIAVDKKTFDEWQKSEQSTSAEKSSPSKSTSNDAAKKETTNTKAENAPKVYKVTVTVKEGMTTSDIAKTLAEKHVIKNKYDLINYVIDHKLEPYLQLGTFTLSSDMSVAQIADKLTKH